MITLFTTTKDFQGKNRINQLNAIRSWLSSSHKPEIIIFGTSMGIEELGAHPNLKIIDQVRTSETGAPYASEMFDTVNKAAKYSTCCYVNADILLTDKFFETIRTINRAIKKNYLLVGARIDVDVDNEIEFDTNWEESFIGQYGHSFQPHPPTGSDYFIFPRGQYHSGNMPDLLIGRPGWDLWMIYNARKRKLKVIDLSLTVLPYHQNHDYAHKANPNKHVLEDEEALLNLSGIPDEYKFLFTLSACNYYYENRTISKNFGRDDFDKYEAVERAVNQNSFIFKLCLGKDKLVAKISQNIFLKMLRSKRRQLNIGAGKFEYENGWLHTDLNSLNITKANEWKKYLRFLKLDNIMSEHVWEHLNEKDTELANKNCYYFLKRKGILRIAVPDGFHPDKNYIEHVRPGGTGAGADDHKILYNYKTMKARLEKNGFTVKLLEYWDEHGNFHSIDWTDEGGRILRSKRYDSRNKTGKLEYTSLIVDAEKP